jgi:hypothetical protein
MYGVILRAVVYAPVAVFLSLIIRPFLREAVDLMQAGPNSDALTVRAVATVEANFLLLTLIALLVMVVARAVIERQLPGGV